MQKFRYQLSKHRCVDNVMKISLPLPRGFSTLYPITHAPLVLRKDIPLKYVFKHIFLSIVLYKSEDHLFLFHCFV